MNLTIVYAIIVFLFGILFTSFYHVLAIRMIKKESLLTKSHCESCNHELRLIDVIPLFGYVVNKGRCKYCNQKIPIKHVLYEMIGGFLFVIAYITYGFSIDFWILSLLLSVLIVESIADIDQMIVIDRIWIIGIIPIIAIRIYQQNILTYLLSSVILFSVLFLIAFLAKVIFKKDALGGGDIKLYLFIGFFLTTYQGLLSIFLASLFGLIYGIIFIKDKEKYIPLVPFISLAVLLCFMYGEQMITWYLNLLGM